jgi:alpha-glucosidase
MDLNGDGVGDLPGVTSKLDYLQSLNIEAIWLSPIFPSPMADFGYDVANYTDIYPLFGTMDDFDHLVAEAHSRGLKVVLDFVPNHSSDEHPWFLESRSSRDNPRRDWYIWRDPAPDGGPPNNWLSTFGGGAWEWDEQTGQYYLHTFLPQQPDLNWRNPEVKAAMYDAMRFWLDRGVDGFRVDVMWWMIKDDQFRDDPPNPNYPAPGYEPYHANFPLYSANRPEVHDVVREMRAVLDEYEARMMVGEIYLPFRELMKYYGPNCDECHLPFNFSLIGRTGEDRRTVPLPFEAEAIRHNVDEYESLLPEGAWPNWVLGNHDQHRIATRIGVDEARLAQMLLLTLRGTPTCYYGDEIGMTDVEIPPQREQDPWGLRVPGLGLGRDPERTPMQWDSSPNAGFSTAEPWLPVGDNYKEVNVALEERDPNSMLSFFRALTALRRATPALSVGSYTSIDAGSADVFAYLREHEGSRVLVALNFAGEPRRLSPGAQGSAGRVLLSTHMDREGPTRLEVIELRPHEGIILEM